MQSGQMAAYFIVLAFAMVGIYDVFCVFNPQRCATASHFIQVWSAKNPLLPLLCGVLIGHLFFGNVCPRVAESLIARSPERAFNDASKRDGNAE